MLRQVSEIKLLQKYERKKKHFALIFSAAISDSAKRMKLEQNAATEDQNGVADGAAENNSTERVTLDSTLTKTDPAKWTVSRASVMFFFGG